MNTVYNRESVWYKKPPNKYHIKYRNYIEAKNTVAFLTLVKIDRNIPNSPDI